jgi:hypothetical protein
MRSKILSPSVLSLLCAVVALPAIAQNRPADAQRERAEAEREQAEARREAERERASAEREARDTERRQAQAEREGIERELARAREELNEAAREVARLSGQLAQPYVDWAVGRWGPFLGQRAMLGLSPEDTELGVRVASVSPNGPAAQAGIEVGDVIVEIDGESLADPRPTNRGNQSPSELLVDEMGDVDPGERVPVKLLRDGQERVVTVQTRKNDALPFVVAPNAPKPPRPPRFPSIFFNSSPWQDMQLVTLTAGLGSYFGTEKGILVVRGPGNDALGLRDGDVILDIGGREPTSPEHAIRILSSFEEDEALRINVMRERRRQTVEVKVPAETDAGD